MQKMLRGKKSEWVWVNIAKRDNASWLEERGNMPCSRGSAGTRSIIAQNHIGACPENVGHGQLEPA
jgi:hypothetical protein